MNLLAAKAWTIPCFLNDIFEGEIFLIVITLVGENSYVIEFIGFSLLFYELHNCWK